ncbi:hypothetical protein D9M71_354020 [compost metagenome]
MQFKVGQRGALLVDEPGDGPIEDSIVVVAGLVVSGQWVLGDDHHAPLRLVDVQRALGVGVVVFAGRRRAGDVRAGQAEIELAAQQRNLNGGRWLGFGFAGGEGGHAGQHRGHDQGPGHCLAV